MSSYLFGDVLARLRKRRGFSTAHAFYKGVHGRRTLGLSYLSYLNLERGRSLPQPARLELLLEVLELPLESALAAELIRAYLTCLLGSDRLLRALETPPAAGPLHWRIAEEGARQAIAQRTYHLSVEQYRLLGSQPAVWSCYLTLQNTAGWIERDELARMTGLRKARMSDALTALSKARLVELSGKKARNPFADKYVAPPPSLPLAGRVREGWRRNEILKSGKDPVSAASVILRMSEAQRRLYAQHLQDTIKLSDIYGDPRKTADSDVYLVEGNIYRLFD